MDEVTVEVRWLRLLYHALVAIRSCAQSSPERAEAIADAVHNVPDRLAARAFDEAFFVAAFLDPLVREHPDLAHLHEIGVDERGRDESTRP